MITTLIGIIKTIILLGVLVIIHEGGHFIVAKLCKVKVNEFSVGFGRKLLQKEINGTQYSLRLIPLRRLCKSRRRRRKFYKRRLFN